MVSGPWRYAICFPTVSYNSYNPPNLTPLPLLPPSHHDLHVRRSLGVRLGEFGVLENVGANELVEDVPSRYIGATAGAVGSVIVALLVGTTLYCCKTKTLKYFTVKYINFSFNFVQPVYCWPGSGVCAFLYGSSYRVAR